MKCPFCDGDCAKCPMGPIDRIRDDDDGVDAEETKKSMEATLKKEFDSETHRWTMEDAKLGR